jgi:hypothetical protein
MLRSQILDAPSEFLIILPNTSISIARSIEINENTRPALADPELLDGRADQLPLVRGP